MVSRFYQRHSKLLLWTVVLTFPFLMALADSMPNNNDLETWLPSDSPVRQAYNSFKEEFGGEEVILVGVERDAANDRLIESLAQRLESLSGIRQCWTPQRMRNVMEEFQVEESEHAARMQGLIVSEDEQLQGMLLQLSPEGSKNRTATVHEVEEQIAYCQLDGNKTHLAGGPVVVTEIDRLGSRKNNKRFFAISLLICLCLLYHSVRQWKLSFAVLGLTVWAINATMATIHLAGGEMNFILGALSVMVMVFTLAIAIHVLHYFESSAEEKDPLGAALRLAWKPCFYATLTTTIGLVSLGVSDIGPVKQFGFSAAAGSIVALITGLGLTPAVITVCPPMRRHKEAIANGKLDRIAHWIMDHSGRVAVGSLFMVAMAAIGVMSIETKIDPIDFLPRDSKVLTDIHAIKKHLTSPDSLEAVVELPSVDTPFLHKLEKVRQIEQEIAAHPAVRHTMSASTFFPKTMPDSAYETASLLSHAKSQQGESDFVSDGGRLWRISVRLNPKFSGLHRQKTLEELEQQTAGQPIIFTGISPLLENAQNAIFDGFWESFATAFLIITAVMIIALRSIRLGLVAMIPNLTPIALVFGVLGWIHFPIDIGTMMTGSIALGIAVDGTFHFLVRYNMHYRELGNSADASRAALLQTGAPIFKAAVITGIGMMALALSNFTPTARFGYMMTSLMLTAVIGDLVLLPALLGLRPQSNAAAPGEESTHSQQLPKPHLRISKARESIGA